MKKKKQGAKSLPLGVEAIIRIDFGKGVKRKYEIVNLPNRKGILDGSHYQIEFCHPCFGEVFITRKLR